MTPAGILLGRVGRQRPLRLAGVALGVLLLIAMPVAARPRRTSAVGHDIRDGNGFTYSFRSAPSLHPPIVSTSGPDPDRASGDIFADAQHSLQAGPLILGPNAQLIW